MSSIVSNGFQNNLTLKSKHGTEGTLQTETDSTQRIVSDPGTNSFLILNRPQKFVLGYFWTEVEISGSDLNLSNYC